MMYNCKKYNEFGLKAFQNTNSYHYEFSVKNKAGRKIRRLSNNLL